MGKRMLVYVRKGKHHRREEKMAHSINSIWTNTVPYGKNKFLSFLFYTQKSVPGTLKIQMLKN